MRRVCNVEDGRMAAIAMAPSEPTMLSMTSTSSNFKSVPGCSIRFKRSVRILVDGRLDAMAKAPSGPILLP